MKIVVSGFVLFLCLCASISGDGVSRRYDIGDIGLTFIEFNSDGTGTYSTASEYVDETGTVAPYTCMFTYTYRWHEGLPFIDITSDPLFIL